MEKTPVLAFGSLDAPLAQAQTQVLLDRIGKLPGRPRCEIVLREASPPVPGSGPEPFLGCCRADLARLADGIRRGEFRAAVVQAYDLSVPLPEGTEILCVPDRGTPFDALLNRRGLIMDELDPGSRIGVLCLRAKNQLQCHWPDLDFQILRGGVDRAMEVHLRRSEIDGLVLPAAVTELLGIQGIVSEIFSPDFILPAPGQGALTVLGRGGDTELAGLLAPLHSEPSGRELAAELAFRRHMVTDMDLPIGALARIQGGNLTIIGATGCGNNRISVVGRIDEAEAAGSGLAQQLLCSPESFADLLEGDFPHGLPPEEDGELEGTRPGDEDEREEEDEREDEDEEDEDAGPGLY